MDTKKLLIAGAIAAGAYLMLSSRTANAATLQPATRRPVARRYDPNKLASLLGASWPVAEWSVQTVNWSKPGGAIGNYTGMSQDAALTQAVTDYNNQFLSPYTTAYGVKS